MLTAFNLPTSEMMTSIYQLLPGFVAAWVFFGFTDHGQHDHLVVPVEPIGFSLIVAACVLSIVLTAMTVKVEARHVA